MASRLALRHAPTRRRYAARRARSGSVMPMLRMSGGIRACYSLMMLEQPGSVKEGSGPLHQGHHLRRVTFSDDLNMREALRNIFPVALGQVYSERPDVLLQITNSFRPRDGHNVFALGEHPRQCQLRRRRAFFAGQLLDRCRQLQVFLQRLLSETGIRPSPIAWVEIFEFLDCTCQESAPKRTVRDERDAKFAASRQYAVGLHLTRPQRILALQRGNRVDFRGAPQRLRSGFRQSDRSDLAGQNKLGHRTNCFFDRNVGINPMLVVEIDRFDAQPMKARVARTADILGRTIHAPGSVGADTEAKLRRHDDAIARNFPQEAS